ncbi:hypothetical protein DL765_009367 [Monosporascus sp. GIB2]|nr:hypothetical protein DL765_009367 [Monosporascus sp. GIB2]
MEDELDYYHTAFLKALRQHRRKFSFDPVQERRNENPQGRHQGKFRENALLKNYREFFEAGLLRILSRDDLDYADIQLLPHKKAQELLAKLHELFVLLDEIASDSFEPTACGSTSSQSLVQPSGPYLRLEKLLSLLDQSEGPFDLASNTSSSIFRINTLVNGKAAHSVVQELNHILDGIQLTSQKRLPLVTADTTLSTTIADNWIQSFDREYRALVGRILDTISAEFAKCDSPGCNSPHQVIIQLPDIVMLDLPSSEMRLDICLYCPRPGGWQNTRCKLNGEAQAGSTQSKKLCEFMKSSLRSKKSLVLLFDKASPAFSLSSDAFGLPTTDPNMYPMRNLKDLITKRHVFNPPPGESEQEDPFKHPERRALAAKLALNLLIFCAWKHTSRPWDGNSVYFLSSSKKDYDRKSPYISCLVGHSSTAAIWATDDNAPIQYFTEFAKLLLEIEYGPLPSGNFNADEDCGWFAIREFHECMQNYRDLSKEKYLEAVEACLQFHELVQNARNTRSGRLETPDETYRRLIRTKIVRNIVADLPGFQQPPPKRTRQAENDEQLSNSDSDSVDGYEIPSRPYPMGQGLQHGFDKANYAQASPRRTRGHKVSFREDLEINAGYLFDAQSSRQRSETQVTSIICDQQNKTIGPTINSSRRTRDKAVRVAVLDTGIDNTHPRIQKHLRCNGSSIIECRDWASSPKGISDCVGHGTASVEYAFIKKKIILAAASNSGSIIPDKRVSYPARIQGQVLGIRSATGQSERSPASPKGSAGDDNFMILGEGIEAAWPPNLNEGHLTRYVSGSSFATPLAAGIASLILEFSIQRGKRGSNVPKESTDTLWSYRGIRRIFRYMSAVDDQSANTDCDMICPWKLFDLNRDYDAYGLEIKRLMKSLLVSMPIPSATYIHSALAFDSLSGHSPIGQQPLDTAQLNIPQSHAPLRLHMIS